MALLIFQRPGGSVIWSFLGNHSSCRYQGKRENSNPLSWEQSNAVWILIKFIKQITQRLREAGVHLPALQIDLCRDASWMVVKAKLQSSADGLPSLAREIWWRSNSFFPLQVFVPCHCWLKKHFSVFFQPTPHSVPLPLGFCFALFCFVFFSVVVYVSSD